MRISSRIMAENVKSNLNRLADQILTTEKRIVTGKKINKPSDDPAGMTRVLDYRRTISTIEQYQENITLGTNRIKYSETILENAHKLLRQAKQIASNPGTDDKASLAREVENIKTQILGFANTKYNNTYIFSGTATDTTPFASDGTYSGSTGEKKFIIGENMDVRIEADGREIFTDGTNNLFDVLDTLQTALNADDMTTIKSQVARLDSIDDNLNEKRASMASSYNRMESTKKHWTNFKVDMQDLLSSTEDADIAQAAIDLKVQQTTYEVALAVSAKIIQPTLMNFL